MFAVHRKKLYELFILIKIFSEALGKLIIATAVNLVLLVNVLLTSLPASIS